MLWAWQISRTSTNEFFLSKFAESCTQRWINTLSSTDLKSLLSAARFWKKPWKKSNLQKKIMSKSKKTSPAPEALETLESELSIDFLAKLAVIGKRMNKNLAETASYFLEKGLSNPKIENIISLVASL